MSAVRTPALSANLQSLPFVMIASVQAAQIRLNVHFFIEPKMRPPLLRATASCS